MSTKSSVIAAVPPIATKQAAVGKTPATPGSPTQDEIAVRAYELFLQDGSMDGRDMEHWLRAEEELRSRKKS